MLQHIRLVGLALLLSVGVGSVVQAASFDCDKATTETEIAICSDPELSALDEFMGEIYLEARNGATNHAKSSISNCKIRK